MNNFVLTGPEAPSELFFSSEDYSDLSGDHQWSIRKFTLRSGLSTGVEVVTVDNGACVLWLVPTRGMGIWKIEAGDLRVGWDAPYEHPVHPTFVDLKSRNGLGWLDGFNELLCRCGLAFNGPPGIDEGAASPIESEVTLHGQISYKPAERVMATIMPEGLLIRGVTREVTVFGPNLELQSDYFLPWNSLDITLTDSVLNRSARPAEMQLLYHINVGEPLLEEGSRWYAPVKEIYPRDPQAAAGLENPYDYIGPTLGYAEQVFHCLLFGDENQNSSALLANSSETAGFALHFDLTTLPCFAVWKNTQAREDGYCTGLEPGTNFPNFKAVERKNGRVVLIPPGESWSTEMVISVLTDSASVSRKKEEIEQLQKHPAQSFPTQEGLTEF